MGMGMRKGVTIPHLSTGELGEDIYVVLQQRPGEVHVKLEKYIRSNTKQFCIFMTFWTFQMHSLLAL